MQGATLHERDGNTRAVRSLGWDRRWLWHATTIIGLLYLVAVAMGLIPAGRFGQTEAIVFVAVLLLNPTLVDAFVERIKSLSVSTRGLEVSLQEVQRKQDQQVIVLETLAFLVANYLPRRELEYLLKIAGVQGDDSYALGSGVRERLRRLREAELIRTIDPTQHIGNIPPEGHMRDLFVVTERGRQYVDLVRQVGIPQGAVAVPDEPADEKPATAAATAAAAP